MQYRLQISPTPLQIYIFLAFGTCASGMTSSSLFAAGQKIQQTWFLHGIVSQKQLRKYQCL